ncbi:MAG: hypothetical protein HYW48_08920 [Deltaproteobacteria bacterium]|nr:hypothetical protein [Deltaproteobacteria bacterium]
MPSPIFIEHRINSIAALAGVHKDHGVEIDLRSDVGNIGKLHLSHDPWIRGDDFDDWLREYVGLGIKGPLILNTKEDGLEQAVLDRMELATIRNFFFLDTALPTLVKWSLKMRRDCFALRLSQHEPAAPLDSFKGRAKWVWVDCFDGVPLTADILRNISNDFKLCIVSPELQQRPIDEVAKFSALLPFASAVCTKDHRVWETLAKTKT